MVNASSIAVTAVVSATHHIVFVHVKSCPPGLDRFRSATCKLIDCSKSMSGHKSTSHCFYALKLSTYSSEQWYLRKSYILCSKLFTSSTFKYLQLNTTTGLAIDGGLYNDSVTGVYQQRGWERVCRAWKWSLLRKFGIEILVESEMGEELGGRTGGLG